MLKTIRNALQHRLNPLHLFCRLCEAGVRPWLARKLCRCWERGFYRMIL